MTATAVNNARSSGAHTAHPTTNGSMYAYAYSTTDTAFADDFHGRERSFLRADYSTQCLVGGAQSSEYKDLLWWASLFVFFFVKPSL